MIPGFTASRRLEDGLLVVTVEGELDLATAPELDLAVGDPVGQAGPVTGAVLDLEGCSFVDSSGARMVAAVGERLARLGVPVRVASPPGTAAREVLELMGVSYRVPLSDSRAHARATIAGGGEPRPA